MIPSCVPHPGLVGKVGIMSEIVVGPFLSVLLDSHYAGAIVWRVYGWLFTICINFHEPMTARKSGKDGFYRAGVAIHGNDAGKCVRRLQTIRGAVPNHNVYISTIRDRFA